MDTTLSRLVYLTVELGQKIPTKLAKYLPFSGELNGLAELGIEGYALREGISTVQIQKRYDKGKASGRATLDEFAYILTHTVAMNLSDEFNNNRITFDEFMAVTSAINAFREGNKYFLHEEATYTLTDDMGEPLEPQLTGIIPIDNLIGGFVPNSLVALAAGTGLGKTRQSLGIGLALMENHWVTDVDVIQLELSPRKQMGMLALPKESYPTIDYGRFRVTHKPYDGNELVRYYTQNPNEHRLVIVDGVDHIIAAGGTGDNRDTLGKIFGELKRISAFNKLVIATTQVNRQGSSGNTQITNEHFADSALKAWQIDLGLGIYFPTKSREPIRPVIMTATKVRDQSTIPSNKFTYMFDYVNFRFSSYAGLGEDEWD